MIQIIRSETKVDAPRSKKRAQNHFRVAEKDFPAFQFSAKLVRDPKELEQLVGSWERLTHMAVRPNPFFDPDYLIPAVKHLGGDDVSVLVVTAPQRVNKGAEEVICCLMPLQRKRFYGLPVSCFEIWKHDQCFDCTPLIRRDCAAEVLEFAFRHLAEHEKIGLLSFDTISDEGEFGKLLTENLYNSNRSAFYRDRFTRACFKPLQDAETYINTNVSPKTRKGTQRLSRKLAEQGIVRTVFHHDYSDEWVDQFLEMELRGWKGEAGTAFASIKQSEAFFREVTSRMLNKQKMVTSHTMVGNRPVAMSCDLLHGNRAAAFKITFDESFKEYSPGLIMELDNISRLHDENISFVDSCAEPNHSMINRVWSDRTQFQNLVIALNGPVSNLAVATMPLIQYSSKLLKRKG